MLLLRITSHASACMATLRHGSGNPCDQKTFQNPHIELYLLLYNISEGSYTPKKPVTMKFRENRRKSQKPPNSAKIPRGWFWQHFHSISRPRIWYTEKKSSFQTKQKKSQLHYLLYGRHLGFWPLDPPEDRFFSWRHFFPETLWL